jgi:hypothetical protein
VTDLICSAFFAVPSYTRVVQVPKCCSLPSTLLPLFECASSTHLDPFFEASSAVFSSARAPARMPVMP